MRIAINTRLLVPGKMDGIAWFTYENLKRISQAHPEHEFIFIFDRKPSPEFIFAPNVTSVSLMPQARHPFLWYIFFEWSIPFYLKNKKIDLFVSPDGWLPLHLHIPTLNVIHDLNFVHYPKHIRPLTRIYYRYFFPLFANKATRLATVSQYSKNDIVQQYGIAPEKIDVVYNGINESYHPLNEDEQAKVRTKISEGNPYFIFVGTIHQRKNLANIFRAFDQFKKQYPSNIKFVIVGSKMWWKGEIEDSYLGMQYKKDLIFTHHLKPDELNQVLASSIALLYPSFFEGFGIPIIEAFQTETAVVTSDVTSMPEVAGNAAHYVSPFSVEQLTQAMHKLSTDAPYRNALIAKGRIQKQKFSWNKTAELFWQSIEKTLDTKEKSK